MFEGLKSRIGVIVAVVLFAAYVFSPNFFKGKENIPSWIPEKALNYGLDIQGGLHLVLGVDSEGVMEEKLSRLAGALKEDINKKYPNAVSKIDFVKEPLSIKVQGRVDEAATFINKNYAGVLQNLEMGEGIASYQYYETYTNQIKKQIVTQAIEVIRNRIDSFGVAEPYIAAQGTDRIIVQLPGIDEKDYQQAKDLINRAARLEFMIVSFEKSPAELETMIKEAEKNGGYQLGAEKEGGLKYLNYVKRLNEDLKSQLPEQTELAFRRPQEEGEEVSSDVKIPVLLKNSQVFTGDKMSDAYVGAGEFGEPLVVFSVASDGRNEFAKLTGENIEKQMAIVLDKVVKSSPNIKARLREGGTITLGNGAGVAQEAQFLTNTLRAGALPAALEQLEERSVGPTLGADSVKAGQKAGILGLVIVLFFMIVWYRVAGLVAGLALVTNIFLLLALLTSLGATLTLPGIAGIVLTVGMAVDANVIIFERIREELFKGSGLRAAIKDGFGHALSAIIDANITTAAVCVVLMFYGSGPIKGFAVTLIWGIITSMFTAIFFTHVVMDTLLAMGIKNFMPLKKRAA